jgi:hypothetical protein
VTCFNGQQEINSAPGGLSPILSHCVLFISSRNAVFICFKAVRVGDRTGVAVKCVPMRTKSRWLQRFLFIS